MVEDSQRSWEIQTGLIIFSLTLTQTFPAHNGPQYLILCWARASVLEGLRDQDWGEAPSTGQCVGLHLTSLFGNPSVVLSRDHMSTALESIL